MATQTEPNVIPDSPVRRSEFQCQCDYFERAIKDHERRIRSFELWQEKIEKRLNEVDADCYNSYKNLKAEHVALLAEMDVLRDVVSALLDQAKETGCECENCKERESVQLCRKKADAEEKARMAARNMEAAAPTCDKEQTAKQQRREYEKIDSTYESFMRAASKMVPQQVNTPVVVKDMPAQRDTRMGR